MSHQAEFLKLIKENERIIFKVCRMYMDTVVDRQDLFQEIVGQAWRSYESFKGLSKFSSWLYRIALNTALTYFKKNKRSKNTIESYKTIKDVIEEEDRQEQIDLMYTAISRLPKIDKAIVMLYLDDYSYQQISEMMGMNISNVGVRINRIKKRLKDVCNELQSE